MAASAGGGPGPERPYKPDWLEKPTSQDMEWAYPAHADRHRVEGKAVIDCAVRPDGRLADCRVVSETPKGEDFGLAAVALSQKFRMLPPPEGYARPVNVTIPVVFRMPESPWPWDRREKSSQTGQAEPSLTPLDGGDLLLITGVLAITCALLVAVVWLARQPGRQSREF
ncbi:MULTISPECIES: TonB family protein [unclassified Caulobacter]|uniref:TonB family protein n=1 Tax=unclassified Caulobacter TaxID=2648921 RepID=UPI001E4F4FF4|nr:MULTISPECIES: TonB family protein [unclassified Caulobacter]